MNRHISSMELAALILSAVFVFPFRAGKAEDSFDYANYVAVLKTYVVDGFVKYKDLKVDRKKLDAFINQLGSLDRRTYESWSEKDKIAFWINAYNGITLQAVIDNYPIKSGFVGSWLYPKNSIRQISGVWDKQTHRVMGEKITLNHIEHETLRKKFNEPRIHMALNCASIGCPALRNEPFEGGKLGKQLDDQSRSFLKLSRNYRLKGKTLTLSSILSWFGTDFVKSYGSGSQFSGFNETERAVLNFIIRHLDEDQKKKLTSTSFSIEFLKYDWALNDKS